MCIKASGYYTSCSSISTYSQLQVPYLLRKTSDEELLTVKLKTNYEESGIYIGAMFVIDNHECIVGPYNSECGGASFVFEHGVDMKGDQIVLFDAFSDHPVLIFAFQQYETNNDYFSNYNTEIVAYTVGMQEPVHIQYAPVGIGRYWKAFCILGSGGVKSIVVLDKITSAELSFIECEKYYKEGTLY